MGELLSLLDLRQGKRGYDRVIFDFRECRHMIPSAATAVIAYRDYLKDRGIETRAFLPQRSMARKFMVSLGFMAPEEGDLTDAYVEAMSQKAVKIKACQSAKECTEAQSQIIRQVRDSLKPTDSALAAIDYMLGELWDNAGVHGYGCYTTTDYPKPVYISSYSYRTHVEVAVLDRGVGIHKTLSQYNPAFASSSAKEALLSSIENGVSGHPNGSPGFGLFSTSEFIRANQGELHMWSSNRKLTLRKGRATAAQASYEHGTLVTFIIHPNQTIPFERIVSHYESPGDYIDMLISEEPS